jgi:hypothetical protein
MSHVLQSCYSSLGFWFVTWLKWIRFGFRRRCGLLVHLKAQPVVHLYLNNYWKHYHLLKWQYTNLFIWVQDVQTIIYESWRWCHNPLTLPQLSSYEWTWVRALITHPLHPLLYQVPALLVPRYQSRFHWWYCVGSSSRLTSVISLSLKQFSHFLQDQTLDVPVWPCL